MSHTCSAATVLDTNAAVNKMTKLPANSMRLDDDIFCILDENIATTAVAAAAKRSTANIPRRFLYFICVHTGTRRRDEHTKLHTTKN